MIHDFLTRIQPRIARGFGNDFFSSERQRGDLLATEDLIRSLAKEKSSFLRDDRSHRLNELQFGVDERGQQVRKNLAGLDKDKVNLDIEQLGLDKSLAGLAQDRLGLDIASAASGSLLDAAKLSPDVLSKFLDSAGIGRDITEKGNIQDELLKQELLKMLLGASTAGTRETVGVSSGGSSGLLAPILQGLATGIV